MERMREWTVKRRYTIVLIAFLTVWYIFQLIVLHLAGETTAEYLFYSDIPNEYPPDFQIAYLFSPISHEMDNLGHFTLNIVLLFLVGSFAEPYINGKKIILFVIILGYFGTILTNTTVIFHLFWSTAGASGGILALASYSGLQLKHLASDFPPDRMLSSHGIESMFSLFLLLMIPAVLLHELLISWNIGHVMGILVGIVYYLFEGKF